jgi:iron complex outermembrane recepter protein
MKRKQNASHPQWLVAMLMGSCLIASGPIVSPAMARQEVNTDTTDLAELDLEQLMSVDVSSVAGKEQSLFSTPASVWVLTSQDIQNSGHQSIPEALRLVPGFHVARQSSNSWAISTRGANGRFANKLLVLMDGRTMYNQNFGGTLWESQQVILADLEKIEVIRGPGATLWGANAVNGVINIETKNAKDTQGTYVTALAGAGDLTGMSALRYGAKGGQDTYYRVWAKWSEYDSFQLHNTDTSAQDNWNLLSGGFRIDTDRSNQANFTLSGDLHVTNRLGVNPLIANPTGTPPALPVLQEDAQQVASLSASMHRQDDTGGYKLQLNLTSDNRDYQNGDFEYLTYELDWRQNLQLGDRNDFVWGLSVRHIDFSNTPSAFASFVPNDSNNTTYSGFVQNTFEIVKDKVFFMAGAKFEYSDYAQFQFQPSARVWWTPSDNHTVWASISRSVHTPTRLERDVQYTSAFAAPNIPLTLRGNSSIDPEVAITAEVGYRFRLNDSFSIDVSAYHAEYDDLVAYVPLAPGAVAGVVDNSEASRARGVVVSSEWMPFESTRVKGSVSYDEAEDTTGALLTNFDGPYWMTHLGVDQKLTKQVTLHAYTYYVSDWKTNQPQEVDYTRLDLGLTWNMSEDTTLSVWGQNLIDPRHAESERGFLEGLGTISEVGRSVYVQLQHKF